MIRDLIHVIVLVKCVISTTFIIAKHYQVLAAVLKLSAELSLATYTASCQRLPIHAPSVTCQTRASPLGY